jgi:hypothetical protein
LFNSGDLGNTLTVNFEDANITGFAIGSNGVYYVSSPLGLDTSLDPTNGSWVRVPAANLPPITCLFVRASVDSPGKDEIYAGSESGLWMRKSGEEQWQKKHDAGDGAAILQVAAFGQNIYYRTNKEAYASHDGGLVWKNISPTTFGDITAILTTSETDVLLAVSGYPSSAVFHSSDGGDTFNGPKGTNFSSRTIQALVVNPDGDLFLGGGIRDEVKQDSISQGYVFRFLHNGAGWEDYSVGLPNSGQSKFHPEVIALGFSSRGKVFASTDSTGLWRTLLPSGVDNIQLSTDIGLSQNFPNPVTYSTEFSVSVDHPVIASLDVVDALGRRVLLMSQGMLTPGIHIFTLNAETIPNGTYFYRLQTLNSIQTKSFVVSR